jgi:hypothetical protein
LNSKPPTGDYAEWLNKEHWTHWATLTFKLVPSVESAARSFWKWWDGLHDDSHNSRESSFFFCVEEGRLFGRVHLHALLFIPMGPAWTSYLEGKWRQRYGIAQVRDYDPTRGAGSYVSKYVVKGDVVLWDIGGRWNGRTLQRLGTVPRYAGRVEHPERPRPPAGFAGCLGTYHEWLPSEGATSGVAEGVGPGRPGRSEGTPGGSGSQPPFSHLEWPSCIHGG